jgi:copper homeostasis protein
MTRQPVEICVDCTDSASLRHDLRACRLGGAARVELCAEAEVGGCTPPMARVREARRILGNTVELLVLLRPRPGDFLYDAAEQRCITRDMHRAADAGANGVVLGALRHGSWCLDVDWNALGHWLESARTLGLSVTFHRAIDEVANPPAALERLARLGVRRVLSSGTAGLDGAGVEQGLQQLERMLAVAGNRLELVAGGGLAADRVPGLVDAARRIGGEGVRFSLHARRAVLREGRVDVSHVRRLVRLAAGSGGHPVR